MVVAVAPLLLTYCATGLPPPPYRKLPVVGLPPGPEASTCLSLVADEGAPVAG
jgi:hypothetical protein